MVALPPGTVTLLFTDIEGSTRLWDSQPEQMNDALVPLTPRDTPPQR